ncbi:MAG TPA: hypothetical protein VGQ80_14240 [Acidimicrobiia bacterium]|nr:hypothetical protein [Acidimicrobiia bacterium]
MLGGNGRVRRDADLAVTTGALVRIDPTCIHGNTPGACLDCHREKNNPDLRTGAGDDPDAPVRNDSGIVLQESGQNYFITTISADDPADYWKICKEKGLWGTRPHSSKAAAEVRANDLIVIWELKRGLRAILKAVSLSQRPRDPGEFPWADPELFVYLFPIEVLVELDEPIGDDFDQPDRISARFHLKNADAQAGFRRLEREQMILILDAVAAAAD